MPTTRTMPEWMSLEARREARYTVSRPGKFEGEPAITPILWDLSLDGYTDDDFSIGESTGWWGLMGKYILHESDNGFVTSTRYKNRQEAERHFQDIVDSYTDPDEE